MGINSDGKNKAKSVESGEGWESSSDTDVYVKAIELLEMNDGGTLIISSAAMSGIELAGTLNGDNDRGNVFLPADALVRMGFSHTGAQATDGPRIMSLSVAKAESRSR